jgi:hypothetical protein
MVKLIRLTFAGLIGLCLAAAQPAAAQTAAAAWFVDEIEFLTRDGGRWITDNSEYVSEQETDDAYGIEWRKSFDGFAMAGRLVGLNGGKETNTYWEFRVYWHPGRGEAVAEQFGWGGGLGVGTVRPMAEGGMQWEQTFYSPAQSQHSEGHRSDNPDANTHVTHSFSIVDGEWRPRRSYSWIRQT